MTTLLHLFINTGAPDLANAFSDWIGLINWTHLLQSKRHVQYFDSFVCGVIKVKINSLIYCSTFSVFFTTFTL